MKFNNDQIMFMKKINIPINFSDNLNDSDYEMIEDKVSEHLQEKGFDENYEATEEGKICESILDML